MFNTLTGVLFFLESGETAEDNRERLIEERFLVPDGFDEGNYCDSVRKIVKLLKKQKRNKTSFTILTTTDCNARCYYCYEMGIRRFSMSAETAADVAEYIARVSGGEEVRLNWFGGEPLYNRDAIDVICGGLRERGIPYRSTMTSNGFFMDAETANTAKTVWNMTNIQITLDGTEQIYNQTKAYIHYNGNAFGRILDNIEAALDAGIEVTIRLNMDGSNSDDLFCLVDELASRLQGRKGIHTYVQLLQQFRGEINAFASEKLAAERCIGLTQKIAELGLAKAPSLGRNPVANHCMADNDACEVIVPDGNVCKCEHYDEAEFVGSIYSDDRDQKLIETWKERAVFPECGSCTLYPMCSMLKKCDWSANGCSESLRIVRKDRLIRRLLNEYAKSKKQETAENRK